MGDATRPFAEPRRQHAVGLLVLVGWQAQLILRAAWPLLIAAYVQQEQDAKYFLWALAAGAVLTVFGAVLHFWRFTFNVQGGKFLVQKGVLVRETVNIPLERVQAVHLEQNLIQRLFGVSGLRVDTAGSSGSELRIHALKWEEAQALRGMLTEEHQPTTEKANESEAGEPLMGLDLPTLLKVGLSQNHLSKVAFAIGGLVTFQGVAWELMAEIWARVPSLWRTVLTLLSPPVFGVFARANRLGGRVDLARHERGQALATHRLGGRVTGPSHGRHPSEPRPVQPSIHANSLAQGSVGDVGKHLDSASVFHGHPAHSTGLGGWRGRLQPRVRSCRGRRQGDAHGHPCDECTSHPFHGSPLVPGMARATADDASTRSVRLLDPLGQARARLDPIGSRCGLVARQLGRNRGRGDGLGLDRLAVAKGLRRTMGHHRREASQRPPRVVVSQASHGGLDQAPRGGTGPKSHPCQTRGGARHLPHRVRRGPTSLPPHRGGPRAPGLGHGHGDCPPRAMDVTVVLP